jgi:hypothetical protein|tara:strand:- start:364 stop:792 length:429 start_codon:yes stop_codon:yes gene_type:complete
MTQVITIVPGINKAADIAIKDNGGYEVKFITSKAKWFLVHNKFYFDVLKGIENGDEEILKHYKTKITVPKYSIFKDGKKIGIALVRHSPLNSKSEYLFIPKTRNRHGVRKNPKHMIHRDYLITQLNPGLLTIWDSAELLYYQ